jgi:predicted O-methyltransferase YrrM
MSGVSSWEETAPLFLATEGFLSQDEGEFLYRRAGSCRGPGAVVEIGSWKGRSTICLAAGACEGVKIYAIDPHSGSSEHKQQMGLVNTLDEFKANIKKAGLDQKVIPLVKTSEQAAREWQGPIEFLFIDGAHEYDLVKQDFDLWSPHLIEGGTIAFHDSVDWSGPKRLVRDEIFLKDQYAKVGVVGSITYARKARSCGSGQMFVKRWKLFLKYFYDYGRTHPVPGWIRFVGKRMLSRV